MQQRTKLKRRAEKLKENKLQDLEAEKTKLDYIRDSRHVWDALQLYITQPHLTEADRIDIRFALLFLTRGD